MHAKNVRTHGLLSPCLFIPLAFCNANSFPLLNHPDPRLMYESEAVSCLFSFGEVMKLTDNLAGI